MDQVDIVTEAIAYEGICILATIIQAEGHSYRKRGATMLLKQQGQSMGTLSPGCLESDLMEYVPSILSNHTPQMIEYDMRPEDDLSWGEHIGCGGLIRILLEPVEDELCEALINVKQKLDAGRSVRIVRRFQDSYMSISYRIEDVAEKQQAGEYEYELGHEYEREYAVRIDPKPRLVLFGAGDDAIPVAELLQKIGFRVTVADYREAMPTAQRFPRTERVIGFPGKVVDHLVLRNDDYVIIMSHNYNRDREFLQAVLPHQLRYLGILGSVTRTERMLGSAELPEWLHYPVGLSIHSDGPQEIAISIAAQLIQIRRGGRAKDETDEINRAATSDGIDATYATLATYTTTENHRTILGRR